MSAKPDLLYAALKAQVGREGTTPDLWHAYLRSQGYSGAFPDMAAQHAASLGISVQEYYNTDGSLFSGTSNVSFVDSTAVNAIDTSFSVACPAGVVEGDFLVFFVYFSNHIRTINSAPAGSSPYLISEPGSLDNFYIYTYPAADPIPPGFTFTNDGISDRGAVVCVALRGATAIDSAATILRSNGTGATTTNSFTSTASGYQLAVFCTDDSAASPSVTSAPAGFTQHELSLAAFSHMWVGGLAAVPSGSQAAQSLTWNSGSAFNRTNISLIVS